MPILITAGGVRHVNMQLEFWGPQLGFPPVVAGYVKHLNLLVRVDLYALCCYSERLSVRLLFVTMVEACSNSL